MKNLLFKRNLTLLLCAVFAMMFVFSSCGKEDVSNVSSSDTQEEQVGDLDMPQGNFTTKLDLRDQNSIESRDENGQGAGALIELSTNNEEIFAHLNKENFKISLITQQQLETVEDRNIEDIDKVTGDIDESQHNSAEHFLTIKILTENVNDDETVSYTLSDELLKILKKYKAGTFIQFSSDSEELLDNRSHYNVYKNYFYAKGDGGNIPTKLNIYYDYFCSNTTYNSQTQYGFYNYYRFRSCEWPWNSSNRKRYRYFYVTQDVLKSFSNGTTSRCESC